MRRTPLVLLLAWLSVALPGPAVAQGTLYQVSLLGALMTGVYDGEVTIGDLARHGDFGLGTVNGLDGELVAVDGRFFRVGADGRAVELSAATATPFAMVTRFTPTVTAPLPAGLDLPGLEAWLTRLLPPGNRVQAIRIDGVFPRLTVRSVPRQTQPFPPLPDALKEQVTFDLSGARGTVVGFRMPGYAKGINAAGFHFHFLDESRRRGGHVLALGTGDGTAAISTIGRVVLDLPSDSAFAAAPLGPEGAGANAVEGQ